MSSRRGVIGGLVALVVAVAVALSVGGGNPTQHKGLWVTPAPPTHQLTACISADCGQWSISLNWLLPVYPGTSYYKLFVNGSQVGTSPTSPYTFTGSDCGITVTLGVEAYNATLNQTGALYSIPYVTPACPPPVNTALPVVSGGTVQGVTLSTTTGSWANSPVGYTYQWQDCNLSGSSCSNISGATGSTYTLAAADVGDTVDAVVTASNTGGSTSATSAYVGPVTGAGNSSPCQGGPSTVSGPSDRCFYIAASGSDSSNGTTESTPWAHAPGMIGCASTCASYSGQAGDHFVFKGGDSWSKTEA